MRRLRSSNSRGARLYFAAQAGEHRGVSWRGLVRGMAAASRRAAKEQARQARAQHRHHVQRARAVGRAQGQYLREAKKQLAAAAKADALNRARAEANEYEARVGALRSVHAESPEVIDWQRIAREPAPTPPTSGDDAERFAQEQLQSFRPGFFDRLFGKAEKQRAQLVAAIDDARRHDDSASQLRQSEFQHNHGVWQWRQQLAASVLSGNLEAYRMALDWARAFEEIEDLGAEVELQSVSLARVELDLFVNDQDVVPAESKSLSAAGKLSSKKLTLAQRNEIYQDYVCGSALRLGREIFAAIPVDSVLVHVVGDLLNTSTGNLDTEAILSVLLVRKTMSRLKFGSLDASDSMTNFVHRMNYHKTKGFLAVEPIDPTKLAVDIASA